MTSIVAGENGLSVRNKLNSVVGTQQLTRAAFVTDVAGGYAPADGTVIFADGLAYKAQSGATAISDLPGWVPSGGLNVGHYGVTGSGDETSAVAAAVAYANTNGLILSWPDDVSITTTASIANLHDVSHKGRGKILRDGNTYYIGEWDQGEANALFVSPTGLATNDGLSSSDPITFEDGFNVLRALARKRPQVQWTLSLAAGTYGSGASRRFEDFPATTYSVEFSGPDVSGGVPTAIFDGWSQSVFRKLDGCQGQRLRFKDMKFINFTAPPIYLFHGFSCESENLHADSFSGGAPFHYRGGPVNHEGGIIEDGDGGVRFQNVYGNFGDTSALSGASGITFNNITSGDGLAACFDASRGTVTYVRNCSFGRTTANDIHVRQSRLSRIRTQANDFGAFNTACITQDTPDCQWNDDAANPDDFTNAGATVGDTPLVQSPGSYVTRWSAGSELTPHLRYNGSVVIQAGTTRAEPDSVNLAPFRMPGFWLMSPDAMGVAEFEVWETAGGNVLLEINGESSGTAQKLASITIPFTGNQRAYVRMEFTGPNAGGNTGRYLCQAFIDGGATETEIGPTGDLTNAAMTASSVDLMRFRFYVTRSNASGDFRIYRMDTKARS